MPGARYPLSQAERQRARPIPMLGMHEAQPRRFGRVMGNLPPEMMYFMA